MMREMSDNEWSTLLAFCLECSFNGPLMSDWDGDGNVIQDDTLPLAYLPGG
ncbi:MAG: hypothetical protein U0074_05375 [Kouleothrix sp.]